MNLVKLGIQQELSLSAMNIDEEQQSEIHLKKVNLQTDIEIDAVGEYLKFNYNEIIYIIYIVFYKLAWILIMNLIKYLLHLIHLNMKHVTLHLIKHHVEQQPSISKVQ